MSYSISRIADRATIRVHGRIVASNQAQLRQLVLEALDDEVRHFVVDFDRADYIDSSGLGALVVLSKKIHEQGGDVRLAHLSRDLRTLFRLTELEAYFDGFGDGPPAA